MLQLHLKMCYVEFSIIEGKIIQMKALIMYTEIM